MLLAACIGFFACFHAISPECSRFGKIAFLALVLLKLLVVLIGCPIACSGRIAVDRQTDTLTPSTVTLAMHVRQGLTRERD